MERSNREVSSGSMADDNESDKNIPLNHDTEDDLEHDERETESYPYEEREERDTITTYSDVDDDSVKLFIGQVLSLLSLLLFPPDLSFSLSLSFFL